MLDRQDSTEKIEQEMRRYCSEQIALAAQVGDGYTNLWREIETYLMAGGKRIRPYLTLLAYTAFGGKRVDDIVPVACAWEFLHASLLVHDDIIDRDTVRHGRLNIAGSYEQLYKKVAQTDTEHYALSAALLAGDLLIAAAHDIVRTSSLSAHEKLSTTELLHQAFFYVGGGELIDVESALYDIDSADVIRVAHYKTATYSFQLPLRCGAQLAAASEEQLNVLDELGLQLGIAFQLQDDLLGVFGSEDKTGKSNRSDIYEKKRTLLVQLAKSQLSQEQSDRLDKMYANEYVLSESDVDEVVGLIASTNARQAMEQHIEERSIKAKSLIDQLNFDEGYKKILIGFVDKLAVRSA